MQTEFLAGVVLAWAIAYVGLGLAFCLGYLVYSREREHLVFGLRVQALAVYEFGFTLAYMHGGPAEARVAIAIAVGGAVLGAALMLHFALLCAKVKSQVTLMRPVYGLTALLEAANVYPGLLHEAEPVFSPVQVGPVTAMHLPVQATALGILACAFIGVSVLVSTVLLGRAAESAPAWLAAFVGTAAMSVTTVHDVLLAAGVIGGTWLAPFGDFAFVFLVSGAFIVRSSKLGKELTDHSIELRRRSSELRRSYEDLREAQRELTRKQQLAAIGELAAVIAHEVRNPLAIISNAVSGLRRRELGHEDRETLLGILREEAARLNRLVGDLLRYARPVSVQKQLVSARELLDRTVASIAPRDELSVEIAEQPGIPAIWGDPGLLRQVFDNLIDNAVQAMVSQTRQHKVLSVSLYNETRDATPGVRVDVHDSGEGMAPHVRQRAMDPFFTTRPSGTGLGLAIVDRIVDAHGGTITIASTTAEGTTVSIFLPTGSASSPPSSAPLVATADAAGEA